MNKGTHFIGQPVYGQLTDLLDRQKILRISREKGGERYVKHFDAWQHLVVMLYCGHQALRLPARDYGPDVSLCPQAVASGHRPDAEAQHPFRRECEEA